MPSSVVRRGCRWVSFEVTGDRVTITGGHISLRMKGDRPLGKHSYQCMMRLTNLGSFFIGGDSLTVTGWHIPLRMKGDRPLGKHSFWCMMRLTNLGSFFIEGDYHLHDSALSLLYSLIVRCASPIHGLMTFFIKEGQKSKMSDVIVQGLNIMAIHGYHGHGRGISAAAAWRVSTLL